MQQKSRGRPREFDFLVKVRLPHSEKVWVSLMATGLGIGEGEVLRTVLKEYRSGGCCHLWCRHEALDEAALLGIGDEVVEALS